MITLDTGKVVPLQRAIKYYKDQARCQRKLGITAPEYSSLLRILQRLAGPRSAPSAADLSRTLGGPEAAASRIEASFRPAHGDQGPGISNKSLLDRRFDISYRPVQPRVDCNVLPQNQRWQTAFQEQLGNEQLFSRTFDMAQSNQIPNVNLDRQAMDCRRSKLA